MPKRRTIGTNPLDAVVPAPPEVPMPQPPAPAASVAKERLTVHLSVDLIDGVKNAVYWTPGLTLSAPGGRRLAPGPGGPRSCTRGTIPAARAQPDRGAAAALSPPHPTGGPAMCIRSGLIVHIITRRPHRPGGGRQESGRQRCQTRRRTPTPS